MSAINKTSISHEDFETITRDAFADVTRHFTAKLTALTAEFSTDASADTKLVIDYKEKHAISGIARAIECGQKMLKDSIKDSNAIELHSLQYNVAKICYKVEFAIRGRLELLEHFYATLTNRSASTDDIALVFRPNSIDSAIRVAVRESAGMGDTAEKMYANGVAAIYDKLHTQLNGYLQRVEQVMHSYNPDPMAAATTATEDIVTKDDLDTVHDYLKKVLDYKLPEIDTLEVASYGADVTGDKLVDRVAEDVGKFYSKTLYEAYGLADDLFAAMSTLGFDEQLNYDTN